MGVVIAGAGTVGQPAQVGNVWGITGGDVTGAPPQVKPTDPFAPTPHAPGQAETQQRSAGGSVR